MLQIKSKSDKPSCYNHSCRENIERGIKMMKKVVALLLVLLLGLTLVAGCTGEQSTPADTPQQQQENKEQPQAEEAEETEGAEEAGEETEETEEKEAEQK
jgi:energy-converting hydrogenase Eha subunit F